MYCIVEDCSRERHTNINGIRFNKCTEHYLKSMKTLRD